MGKTHVVEYLVVFFYFMFMIITGIVFRRFNQNFNDYFRSGCRGTWWLVGASIFMASFTAWTFTGAAGVAYESGISVAIIFIANGLGYLLNYLCTAARFRQLRAITGPEIIKNRFDTTTQQFYIWVGIIPGILMSSLTLWGTAVFTAAIFGFNLSILIVILGLVVLIYSTLGGIWSVMATDFLQALILMPMTILVAYLSLQSIGGWSHLVAEVHRQQLPDLLHFIDTRNGSMFTPGYMIAMVCFVLISYNSLGSSVKYFACKDGREAKKAAALASLLMFMGVVLWFIPPMVAKLQFAGLVDTQHISKPADAAYAVISMQLLANGLSGMIVVAMFAATMSSLSPQLNQYAAIITQDIYRPFIRKTATEKEIFIVGQIASIFVGILIILSALYLSRTQGKGLFEYMMKFGSLFGTPMLIPMFISLFIRRTPVWSAIFSICCSAIVSFCGWKFAWSYERTVFTILIIGSISYLLTIPFWKYAKSEYQNKVRRFYQGMNTPVDFEQEVGQANDPSQLKLVGYVSLAIGLFVALLLLVPNPLGGRLQILFVSGCISLFGMSMIYTGKRRERKQTNSV
ncbi:MAG: hypothetical protein ACE14V_02960 [bacterium]